MVDTLYFEIYGLLSEYGDNNKITNLLRSLLNIHYGWYLPGGNPGNVFGHVLTVYRQQASNLDPGVADI